MGLTQHSDSQVATSLLPITELSVNFLQGSRSSSPAALEGFSNYAVALLQGSRRNLTVFRNFLYGSPLFLFQSITVLKKKPEAAKYSHLQV